MKVKITDRYYLTSDAHNVILNEVQGGGEGKGRLRPIGFYPSIVQALDGLLRLKGIRSQARTLEGLVREHKDFVEYLKKSLPTIRQAIKEPS